MAETLQNDRNCLFDHWKPWGANSSKPSAGIAGNCTQIALQISLIYVSPKEYKVLDGATVVPGSLVVKPVFYSHCYADNQI